MVLFAGAGDLLTGLLATTGFFGAGAVTAGFGGIGLSETGATGVVWVLTGAEVSGIEETTGGCAGLLAAGSVAGTDSLLTLTGGGV